MTQYLFRNFYVCPNCGHEWDDEWECQVDDECSECGERDISPVESEDIEVEDDDQEVSACLISNHSIE